MQLFFCKQNYINFQKEEKNMVNLTTIDLYMYIVNS